MLVVINPCFRFKSYSGWWYDSYHEHELEEGDERRNQRKEGRLGGRRRRQSKRNNFRHHNKLQNSHKFWIEKRGSSSWEIQKIL